MKLMYKARKNLRRFWLRLKICYLILFKHKRGVCIYPTEQQLIQILKNEPITGNITFAYYAMVEYQAAMFIKYTADCIKDVDVLIGKVTWEMDAEEQLKKNKT